MRKSQQKQQTTESHSQKLVILEFSDMDKYITNMFNIFKDIKAFMKQWERNIRLSILS